MSYLDSVFGLDGSTAVVTGGTSGLGAASAIALAKAGAKVVVSGRDRKRGEGIMAEIADAGGSAELELADVSDASAVVEFAQRVIKHHGPVDILVNAAGVFHRGDAADVTLDDWDASRRHQRDQHVPALPGVRARDDQARPGQDRQLLIH